MEYRIEKDTMGEIKVPADKLWGAATQRSVQNFHIGWERMPLQVVYAIALVKKACAVANCHLGVLDAEKRDLIVKAADEVLSGDLDEHFPLSVWQTGSGTQTNMNVNEVLANRGNAHAGRKVLHPNDDVNRSQSSNDVFPSAMHIAATLAIVERLFPSIDACVATLSTLVSRGNKTIKCGRTHLQDAVPITFGQEASGWQGLVASAKEQIEAALPALARLAIGGTAVGTGLNAPQGFDEEVAGLLSQYTGQPFVADPNKFHALSGKDALVSAHGALKALACNMMKIANDVRWLASGPRCGLGEISVPAMEPGSSIMPGKVNPTQCEAVTMVAAQVMGNDVTIGVGASQGNFQLNVYMPVLIYNFLQSVTLLSDSIQSFTDKCLAGIQINEDKMRRNVESSLMLVTALSPYIGYEKAATCAKKAYQEGISLRQACLSLGFMSAQEFDQIVRLDQMV